MLWRVICDIFRRHLHFGCIFTHGLVVERHHLAADVPERLWVVIGGVHSGSFRINPAHLPFIISEKDHLGNAVLDSSVFVCQPWYFDLLRCPFFFIFHCTVFNFEGYSTNSTAFLAIIVSPLVSTKDEMT